MARKKIQRCDNVALGRFSSWNLRISPVCLKWGKVLFPFLFYALELLSPCSLKSLGGSRGLDYIISINTYLKRQEERMWGKREPRLQWVLVCLGKGGGYM